jgi:hypothetical protein
MNAPLDSFDDECYLTHSDFFSLGFNEPDNFQQDFIRAVKEDTCDDLIVLDHDVGDEGITAAYDTDLEPTCCSVRTSPVPTVRFDTLHRAQVDSGADRTTTPHCELIHDFRIPDPSRSDCTHIGDAGEHSQKVLGHGYFYVRAEHHLDSGEEIILRAPCMYIPTIPSTLVNFLDIPRCQVSGMLVDVRNELAYQLVELEDVSKKVVRYKVPLIRVNTRLYTANRLIPSSPSSQQLHYNLQDSVIQRIISDEPTRLLWHACLGHLNYRSLSSLHHSVHGLPHIKDPHMTERCPSCLELKLRHSAAGQGSIIDKATSYGQVLAGDWGFICMKSADEGRIKRLQSYYGETSYLIFTCAYSGALFGVCSSSKAVPTDWLDTFFYHLSHKLHNLNKTILVDRGSELGRSCDFERISSQYRYHMITCGPDKSSMNGLGERPHSTISDAIRTMLHSAGLDLKFWNFAFYHFIRLYNLFPHGDCKVSPFEIINGRKPDVSRLRIFGCRVYIRPPGRRVSKLDHHVIKGIFLGYTATLKQIYYLEDSTGKVKVASHARFDEGMNDLPLSRLPPFALSLRKALGHNVSIDDDELAVPDTIDIFCSSDLFPVTFTHTVRIMPSDITNENDTLGFIMNSENTQYRPYISTIVPHSTASQFPRWRSRLIGAFILSVNTVPVLSKPDIDAALSAALVQSSGGEDAMITIRFAVDKSFHRETMHSMTHSALQSDQLCRIAAVMMPKKPPYRPHLDIYDSGERVDDLPALDDAFAAHLDDIISAPSLLSPAPTVSIRQLLATAPRLTRRILLCRDDWKEWNAAEHVQLDAHHTHRTFGKPMI